MVRNKKAQGLSINAIILIVLGVFVLIALILGFVLGWDNIRNWIMPSNNVDDIVSQCNIACTTNSVYDYCTAPRNVKTESETISGSPCYVLYKQKPSFGIPNCPSISCNIYDTLDLAKASCKGKAAGAKIQYIESLAIKEYPCATADL